MFSRLIVALFALFALSVFSSPIPCDSKHTHSDTPTPTSTPSSPPSSPEPSSPPPPSYSPTPTTTPAASPPAQTSAPADNNSSNGPFSGGIATYFYQGGNAGACGNYNPDSAMICAMDSARFDMSLCGQQVQITNTVSGQSITVTVADECPTCDNSNSIDLSVGAFSALSGNDLSEGVVDIVWSFL
ncbi:RlpA-like double-psi beta-barrel-containing domain containing protein, partial [Tylopilus felleus]